MITANWKGGPSSNGSSAGHGQCRFDSRLKVECRNTTIFSLALSRSSLKQDSLVRDGDVMGVQTKIGCY